MPAEERGPDLRQAIKVTRPRSLAEGPATPLERVQKLQSSLHAKAKSGFRSIRIISAGLEVVPAFAGFEDIGAGVERVQEACDGSLGDFA